MRKNCLLLLMMPWFVSCYEEIIIPVGEKEPVLVMNAQMNSLEQYHHILLSSSYLSKVEPLHDADVQVFVNGSLVARPEEAETSYQASWYGFEASFQPGDIVRITAGKDGRSVSAEVTVPSPVPIGSIDTSSVRMTFLDETTDYLQLKVRFRDLPGPSWYGVAIQVREDWEYRDSSGTVIPEYSVSDVRHYLPLETGFDPVISEGAGKTVGGDLASLLSAENTYHCFSDGAIADEECTLRVLCYPHDFYMPEFHYGLTYPSTMTGEESEWETLSRLYRRVTRSCRFCLRSLDFSQYHYLKALENLETFGGEVSFLVEPTTLPSNVEGGLGFVGIEAVTEVECARFEREYTPLDDILYTW